MEKKKSNNFYSTFFLSCKRLIKKSISMEKLNKNAKFRSGYVTYLSFLFPLLDQDKKKKELKILTSLDCCLSFNIIHFEWE